MEKQEIVKFEKDKVYTYKEIVEIFEEGVEEAMDDPLPEEFKKGLEKSKKSKMKIELCKLEVTTNSLLFLIQLRKKLFEKEETKGE